MQIGFFKLREDSQKDYFQKELIGHELSFIDQNIDPENLPEKADFDIISIFVASKITKEVLDQFPNLKMIAIRATGFDCVDLNEAKSRGVAVANVPAYGSHTVAEFAFGLILSLSRNLPEASTRIKSSGEFNYEGLGGFDLFDKTIGVIGTGKIGANVIRIAQGFGMKIKATDPFPNEKLSTELGFQYSPLEELLKESDIVTIHVPATPETNHLINSGNISLIKPGSLLINTARGSIVEVSALVNWLKQNPTSRAGLDVLEDEKSLTEEEKQLIALPNTLITPHMAFFTKEAEASIMATTKDNILGFISGNPVNLVK